MRGKRVGNEMLLESRSERPEVERGETTGNVGRG